MTVPLMILAIGALVAGIINLPGFRWLGPVGDVLGRFLEPVFQGAEAVPFNPFLAVGTLLISLAMGYIGWRVYGHRTYKAKFRDPIARYVPVFEAFETAFGSDDYVQFFMRPFRATAGFLSRVFDPLGIDGLVNGTARLVGLSGLGLRRGQSGYLRNYTFVFLLGAVALIGYFGYAALR